MRALSAMRAAANGALHGSLCWVLAPPLGPSVELPMGPRSAREVCFNECGYRMRVPPRGPYGATKRVRGVPK
eukprot:1858608-Pyramimonas_sp.AAC.1